MPTIPMEAKRKGTREDIIEKDNKEIDKTTNNKLEENAVNEESKIPPSEKAGSSKTDTNETKDSLLDNKNLFNCPLCLYVVDNKTTLREHLTIDHYQNIILEKFGRLGLSCSLCGKVFTNSAQLARHLGINHQKLKVVTTIHKKVYSGQGRPPRARLPCHTCASCEADNCTR